MTTDTSGTARVADRGQTTLDFVIAIGVFLLAVAFVFVFMTNMMGPFTQPSSAGAVADRVVDTVVADISVTADGTSELDDAATVAYFTTTDDGQVAERAGVSPLVHVNVTIGYPADDGSGLAVISTADGQRLQVGAPVPDSTSTSVATARRTVLEDGRIAIVSVKVWS